VAGPQWKHWGRRARRYSWQVDRRTREAFGVRTCAPQPQKSANGTKRRFWGLDNPARGTLQLLEEFICDHPISRGPLGPLHYSNGGPLGPLHLPIEGPLGSPRFAFEGRFRPLRAILPVSGPPISTLFGGGHLPHFLPPCSLICGYNANQFRLIFIRLEI
jgi:hypothetical protein